MYSTLLWNLYVQGKLPEEKLSDIKYLLLLREISDPNVISDFLIWLRNYNEKSGDKKVYIAGNVDIHYNLLGSPLFDYLDTYYNETTKELILPLLNLLNKRKRNENEGLEYMANNKEQLISILGDTEYDILYYVLSRLFVQKQIKSLEQSYANLQTRDFSMYNNSKKFIEYLLAKDETAVIVAHLDHTNKKYSIGIFPYVFSMGYYLNEYYGDSYYNIGFLVGEGKITTRKIRQQDITVTNLKYPQDNSLEKLCMEQSIFSFYYNIPSDKNGYHTKYRWIGNGYLPYEEYSVANLATQLDAFIFIKESQGYRDMNRIEKIDAIDIMWNKGFERARRLKKYNE